MDAKRSGRHRLAYIFHGHLLAHGTLSEVIEGAHLTTWAVRGPDLMSLSQKLRGQNGIQQTVAFGSQLHVSGDNAELLESTRSPRIRTAPYDWNQVETSLEDVFIHLMETNKEPANA